MTPILYHPETDYNIVDKLNQDGLSRVAVMLIGLISDTHIPVDAKELPEKIFQVFRDVDLIFHAGDVYSPTVLDDLSTIAPLLVARGDDDYHDILLDERMKKEHIVTFEGITIWLFHEFRAESWQRYGQLNEVKWDRAEKHPDVIVYGHTHKAGLEYCGSVLTVTPGSATFPNYVRTPGTVGLLRVNSGKAEAQIIQL